MAKPEWGSMYKRTILAIILSLLLAGLWKPQDPTSLSGSVTDPSGAAVPNATLTLINNDTSARRETRADTEGRYSFQQVQPGHYHLLGKAAGSSDVIVNDIRLLVDSPATIPIVFEKLGTVATTIAVSAESIQLN